MELRLCLCLFIIIHLVSRGESSHGIGFGAAIVNTPTEDPAEQTKNKLEKGNQ